MSGGSLGATVGSDAYPGTDCSGRLVLDAVQSTQVILAESDTGSKCQSATLVLMPDGTQLDVGVYNGGSALSGNPDLIGILSQVSSFS